MKRRSDGPISVLLVEDSPSDAELLKEQLWQVSADRFQITHFERLDEALARLREATFDVILLDLSLPDSTGLDTFSRAQRCAPRVPLVVLTGQDNESLGIEAVRHGVQDYLIKGQNDGQQIARVIRYALERKFAEESLRESENRYRQLVELSPVAILVQQGDIFHYSNPSGLHLFGVESPQQLIGKRVADMVHPDFRSWAAEQMQLLRKTGGTTPSAEIQILRLDGQSRWVEASATSTAFEDRPSIQLVLRDITERKQSQDALKRIEWLLTKSLDLDEQAKPSHVYEQLLSELSELTSGGDLYKALGADLLHEILSDYADLLGTSVAIYEKDSDHTVSICSSGWCRFMDQACSKMHGSPGLASNTENTVCLRREYCCREAADAAYQMDKPGDFDCPGGLHIYGVPIRVGEQNLGALLLGYGDPPKDPAQLEAIADRNHVSTAELQRLAAAYESRPQYLIQSAKSRLFTSARLIGEILTRKQAEEELQKTHATLELKVIERTAELARSNQCLRMISACNQVLAHVSSEHQLIQEICRIINDFGGYRMAWVGYADQDEAKTVRPAASIGFESGYLEQARISWADAPHGWGPTGTAIRTGEVSLGNDFLTDAKLAPWREQAQRCGFRSSIALPLIAQSRVFGALTIYADQPAAFGSNDIGLLRELTDDLAFGIMALRAQADRDHARQELEVKANQLRLLASEMTQAEQRERRRLAQFLHDDLQQLLVGARFNLEFIRKHNVPAEISPTIKALDEILLEAIASCRSLTYELTPPILYEGGLTPTLEWLGRWMLKRYSLTVNVQADDTHKCQDEQVNVLLYQTVRELLFNTLKHSGVKIAQVSISQPRHDLIQVTVQDEGQGFDPEAVNAREGHGGGFGLFSIRQRLELMGGQMHIQSAPGKGSHFTLLLPMKPSSDAGELDVATPLPAPQKSKPAKTARSPKPSERARKKIRLVVADDHTMVRQGLVGMLQTEPDIEVLGEAADGQQAIELARQFQPDVIIMDINMPRVNGLEATRRITSEFPRVRVIALSMLEEAERASAMRKAGAVAYINKAKAAQELVSCIRACVSKKTVGTH